jgi:hypothetical protein
MKKLIPLLIVALALCLSGCAQVALDVPPEQAGRVQMLDGRPVLVSKKRNVALVSFSPEPFPAGQRGVVTLAVKNQSGQPFNIGPENVQVAVDGKAMKVFTHQQITREIQAQATAQAIAVAMAGASQAMAASMPATTTTYGTTSTYGNYSGTARPAYGAYTPVNYSGSYTGHGSYSGTSTTYNPAATAGAVANINANTTQQMGVVSQNRAAALQNASAMLKTTTVPSGGMHEGNVVFKLPSSPGKSPKNIRLTVFIPGDVHPFDMIYKPAKWRPTVATISEQPAQSSDQPTTTKPKVKSGSSGQG